MRPLVFPAGGPWKCGLTSHPGTGYIPSTTRWSEVPAPYLLFMAKKLSLKVALYSMYLSEQVDLLTVNVIILSSTHHLFYTSSLLHNYHLCNTTSFLHIVSTAHLLFYTPVFQTSNDFCFSTMTWPLLSECIQVFCFVDTPNITISAMALNWLDPFWTVTALGV